MKYFDTHSHLYFPDFDADREDVMLQMKENEIATVTIGVDFETSQKSIDLAENHQNIFASVGLHPEHATREKTSIESIDTEILNISKLASHPKVVCIGECGLDFFKMSGEIDKQKKVQKEIFERQIELALKVGKPLMLHIRPSDKINFDAYKDALDILESYVKKEGDKLSGAAHFFVGNLDVLKRFLNIGFSVTFGGVLTFVHEYDEYVRFAPLDRILSETDSPFVAPVPYRGKRNSSLYVPEVSKAIARIRSEKEELVSEKLVQNALKFFKIVS